MGYLLSVHQQIAGSNPVWCTTQKLYSSEGCGALPSLRQFTPHDFAGDLLDKRTRKRKASMKLDCTQTVVSIDQSAGWRSRLRRHGTARDRWLVVCGLL